jgi:hypothetical protein
MLVSPEIAEIVAVALGIGVHPARMAAIEQFLDAFDAAPRVHADDDAIRWLTNRQEDAT